MMIAGTAFPVLIAVTTLMPLGVMLTICLHPSAGVSSIAPNAETLSLNVPVATWKHVLAATVVIGMGIDAPIAVIPLRVPNNSKWSPKHIAEGSFLYREIVSSVLRDHRAWSGKVYSSETPRSSVQVRHYLSISTA